MGLLNLISGDKIGNLMISICPFCGGQIIYNDENYVCYDCNRNGDAADFLAEKNQVSRSTAEWQLGKRPDPEIFKAINAANEYFKKQLSPNNRYLEKRNVSKEVIQKFSLGWADGHMTETLLAQGFKIETLVMAGLTKLNGDDVFFSRIMFPIKDHLGKIIAFGGRKIRDSAAPKYINSPETIVFSKRNHLFGIDNAKGAKEVYLVEGYMDVVSLYQAGITNAVACLGTAVGKGHTELLQSLKIEKVFLCLDGDAAGITNAQKALPGLNGLSVEILELKNTGCKDPDEFIKAHGKEAFLSLNKTPVNKFLAKNGKNPVDIFSTPLI